MKAGAIVLWIAKAAAIYAAIFAASVIGGLTVYRDVAAPEGFDIAAAQRVMLAVNAVYAVLLAVLASNARGSRLMSAALLFALFFGVQTALSQMEAVYFAESFDYPVSAAPRELAAGALNAAFGAIAAALLFSPREETYAPRGRGALAWRFAAATLLYPVAYWTAGLLIAWRSEDVRDFYNNAEGIEPGPLLAFQIFRGAIWAGLALWAGYGLRGARLSRAVLVGAAFFIFMAAQLFYPSPFMPEPVRMAHFVEIGVSNFLYGLIAAMLLAPQRVRGAQD
ncbi:MAG: hypothetical protein KAH44_00920 [Oricola sp.]|jgi:hypothetical protein|nr:hypothetical protein [Oricola sp.]